MLSDKFVILGGGGQRYGQGRNRQDDRLSQCEIKSMDLTEPAMSMIDADTYALSYKAAGTARCNDPDGKPMKVPSPIPFGQHLGPQRRQMAGGLPRRERDRRSESSASAACTGSQKGRAEEKMTRLRLNQIRLLTPLLQPGPRLMPTPTLSSRSNSRYGKHGRHTTPKSSTI